jgi:hypothetical protein
VRLGVVLAAARAGQAAVTRPGTAPGQAAVPGLDPPPEGIPQTNPPGSKRWNPPPRYIKTIRVPPTLPKRLLVLRVTWRWCARVTGCDSVWYSPRHEPGSVAPPSDAPRRPK